MSGPTSSQHTQASEPLYHLGSVLDSTNASGQALNLTGLLGRVEMPSGEEGEEALLQPSVSRTISRHTRYAPSPTLSYYANFIPATPAPMPVPPMPTDQTATATTSFAVHRSDSPGFRPGDRKVKRKEPPAPIDVDRACGTGRKAQAMNRQLPLVITLESPVQDEHSDHRAAISVQEDQSLATRQGPEVSEERQRGLKSIWRSRSRSGKPVNPASEPSPEWVEVEQGYRHPSWMGGLDVRGIELLKPTHSEPVVSHSPSVALTPSPGTGGILHNILLTPTYGGSTSRHRTPSPGRSSTNLIPTECDKTFADDCTKKQKRRTLMDRAGRLLNEQRLKLVYEDNKRAGGEQHNSVKVGGFVPHSFSGYKGRIVDEVSPGHLPLHRMHSYNTSDSARQSGYEVKGRHAMDSERGGSFRTATPGAREGVESGREKSSRGMYKSSASDKDALLRKRRRKKLIFLGAIILLIIASAVIGLCAGLLTHRNDAADTREASDIQQIATGTSTSPGPAPTATSATFTLATCLSLFALSAPSAPRTYPCDQCLPFLRTAKNDFVAENSAVPSGNSTGVGAAVQFCGLQSIFANTDGVDLSGKRGGVLEGWMQNANPCSGWSGITCDEKSRVNSLSLVYPGVPRVLDASIAGLVALERVKIVGDSQIPSGPVPAAFFSSSLTAVDIQSTGLTSLSNGAFAGLASLTNLVLVSNKQLGSSLPPLPQTLKLATISVTGQSLTADPFPGLPGSLTYIDLSYNALTGPVPDLGKFIALESLFLDSNAFTIIPETFPSNLRDLSLQGNPSLAGVLPPQLCSSSTLKTCELQGTVLGPANAQNTTTTQIVAIATRLINATATTTLFATATAIATSTARCGVCRF